MEVVTIRSLQEELSQARESLRGVDENIRRFMGRDPSEIIPSIAKLSGIKRTISSMPDEPRPRSNRILPGRRKEFGGGEDVGSGPPSNKRRAVESTVFSRKEDSTNRRSRRDFCRRSSERQSRHKRRSKDRHDRWRRNSSSSSSDTKLRKRRLAGPISSYRDTPDSGPEEDDPHFRPALQSQVIATPGMVVSKQEVVQAQNPDEKSKARNRRMFGALLGTLQKFQQEETKLKEKEDKRARVELKLEEAERQEREKVRTEKQSLLAERKRKQADIKKIEYKMYRMKEQEEWEEKQRFLVNFIKTKASPSIFYLPKIHTPKTVELLAASHDYVERSIDKKRLDLQNELEAVERRQLERERRDNTGRNRLDGGSRRRGEDRSARSRWTQKEKTEEKYVSSKLQRQEHDDEHDDSDLEAEAGPELDADAPVKGDDEAVHVEEEEKAANDAEVTLHAQGQEAEGDQEEESANQPKQQSMSMDEKEFEPVYD